MKKAKKEVEFKEHEKKIRFDVYGYTVFLVFTTDITKSVTLRKDKLHLCEEDCDSSAGLHVSIPGKSWSYIFLPSTPRVSAIAHECYHCVVNVMKWVGISHEEEVMAYHLGWLVGEIYKFWGTFYE